MPLDKTILKANIESDLSILIGATGIASVVEAQLNEELKGLDGGFRTSLVNIKERSKTLDFSNENFYGLAQTIVAEEFAKTISSKLSEILRTAFLPILIETISTAIADRVDAFIKTAEIKTPAGQIVEVNVNQATNGVAAGETVDESPVAIIS